MVSASWWSGAEHPQPVSQQLLVRGGRVGWVTGLPTPAGESSVGDQSVGVVGAEQPHELDQQPAGIGADPLPTHRQAVLALRKIHIT